MFKAHRYYYHDDYLCYDNCVFQDHVLSLVLVDTTGEEDLCINDRLVKDGLAEFIPNDQVRQVLLFACVCV